MINEKPKATEAPSPSTVEGPPAGGGASEKALEGTIEGIVTTTRGPLAGAVVSFGEFKAVTDQGGRFTLEHLPVGHVQLQVASPTDQFTSSTMDVSIEANERKDIYVFLRESNGLIEGTVMDEAGNVIGGAKVWGVISSLEPTTVEADEKGHYSFKDVPAGEHFIRAKAPGFMAEGVSVRVTGGKTTAQDFRLKAAALSIKGRVVDMEGRPVDAELYLLRRGIVVLRVKNSPEDGSYAFPDLLPDLYEITVVAGGYNPRGWHGRLEKDEVVELRLEKAPATEDFREYLSHP